jgi:hypothetical protein
MIRDVVALWDRVLVVISTDEPAGGPFYAVSGVCAVSNEDRFSVCGFPELESEKFILSIGDWK